MQVLNERRFWKGRGNGTTGSVLNKGIGEIVGMMSMKWLTRYRGACCVESAYAAASLPPCLVPLKPIP